MNFQTDRIHLPFMVIVVRTIQYNPTRNYFITVAFKLANSFINGICN